MTTTKIVPFTVSPRELERILTIVWVFFVLWFFLFARGRDGELFWIAQWNSGPWGIAKILTLVGLSVFAIPSAFISRVVFQDSKIERRDMWGRQSRYSYADVIGVQEVVGEYVKLRFKDGRTLRVFAKGANSRRVLTILSERCRLDE